MIEQRKTPEEIDEQDADGVRCELLLDALTENCTTHHYACGCREGMQKALGVAYEEYLDVLGAELNELVPMASLHGWKSKRYYAGVAARKRILQLRERLGA